MDGQRVSAQTRGLRVLLVAALCAGSALHFINPANAQSQTQTYPNRPIKVIVPFPAGGPTDGMARIISDRLGTVLGQSIVVENRGGGAGGSVGAKVVATADPDGYTILMTPGGSLTTGPAVHKNIGYDPFKDFTPVAKLIETPQYICVYPTLPVKSLADVAAYAKANPGKLSWGSQGFGTGTHLLAELFKLETGDQHRARALSRHGADACCHAGWRDSDRDRPQHHRLAAHPGRRGAADRRRHAGALRRNCRTCRPRQKQAIRSWWRHSGSAWSRRPEPPRTSSTNSMRLFAKA